MPEMSFPVLGSQIRPCLPFFLIATILSPKMTQITPKRPTTPPWGHYHTKITLQVSYSNSYSYSNMGKKDLKSLRNTLFVAVSDRMWWFGGQKVGFTPQLIRLALCNSQFQNQSPATRGTQASKLQDVEHLCRGKTGIKTGNSRPQITFLWHFSISWLFHCPSIDHLATPFQQCTEATFPPCSKCP